MVYATESLVGAQVTSSIIFEGIGTSPWVSIALAAGIVAQSCWNLYGDRMPPLTLFGRAKQKGGAPVVPPPGTEKKEPPKKKDLKVETAEEASGKKRKKRTPRKGTRTSPRRAPVGSPS